MYIYIYIYIFHKICIIKLRGEVETLTENEGVHMDLCWIYVVIALSLTVIPKVYPLTCRWQYYIPNTWANI